MARGPVRRRFWRNTIDSRRRPRVEDGLRPGGQYEVRISQRRRAAMIEEIELYLTEILNDLAMHFT